MRVRFLEFVICVVIASPQIVLLNRVFSLYLLIINRAQYRLLLSWWNTVKWAFFIELLIIVKLVDILVVVVVLWGSVQRDWIIDHVMGIRHNLADLSTVQFANHYHLVFSAIKQIPWVIKVVWDSWGIVWVEAWGIGVRAHAWIKNAETLAHVTSAWRSSYSLATDKVTNSRLWRHISCILWTISHHGKSSTSIIHNSSRHSSIFDPTWAVLGRQVTYIWKLINLLTQAYVLMIQIWRHVLLIYFRVTPMPHFFNIDTSWNVIASPDEIAASLGTFESGIFVLGVVYLGTVWHYISWTHEGAIKLCTVWRCISLISNIANPLSQASVSMWIVCRVTKSVLEYLALTIFFLIYELLLTRTIIAL